MSVLVITLPAIGKRVTVGQYVTAVKRAKANREHMFPYGLETWWPTSGQQIVDQFREGMHARIDLARPYVSAS